jgi:DNA-binding transcriptional ArsR family regulator
MTSIAGRRRVAVSDELAGEPSELSPEAAFKILGNVTRLAILDALWGPKKTGQMEFAELRKSVGMRDGSQFNFHLKKLVDGGFVAKVDHTYSLRQAGARVMCTLRTGYLTEHPELAAFETTGRCYACASPLQARYEDEMYVVECSACDLLHANGWFPPTVLTGRTPEEALQVGEAAMRAAIGLAVAGICPVCNGPIERTFSRDGSEIPILSPSIEPDRDGFVRAWYVCPRCSIWMSHSPGDSVVDHPAVVALYSDHGVDIRTCLRWELPWTVDNSVLDVVSEDPFRVRLTVALAGDERVLTLDEAFDVVAVE